MVGDVFEALFAALLAEQAEALKTGGDAQAASSEDAAPEETAKDAPSPDVLAAAMTLLAPMTQQAAAHIEEGEPADDEVAPAKADAGFEALLPEETASPDVADQAEDAQPQAAAPRPEHLPHASARAQERANTHSAVARLADAASETKAGPAEAAPVQTAPVQTDDASEQPVAPKPADTITQAVAETARPAEPAAEPVRATKSHKTAAHEAKAAARAEATEETDEAPTAEHASAAEASDPSVSFERDDLTVTRDTPKDAPARTEAAKADDNAPQLAAVAHEHAHPSLGEAAKAGPTTVAHLTAQIVQKIEQRTTRFDVQLEPYGLGKVEVRVEIGASGDVSAALTFDNPQAAAELRHRSGELQTALEQAGFDPSRTSLSFSTGGQAQQQNQAWNQQQAPVWRGRAFANLGETDLASTSPASRRNAAGGVDVTV